MEKLTLLWALVKRDYALQYAGSFLGISWMVLQNLALISVYAVVFLVFSWKREGTESDYIAYLLTGLLFWIPLQELLVRGTGILSDNRSLIKRSNIGPDLFLWIPFVQYLIHSFLTAIPVFFVLLQKGKVSVVSFGIGYLYLVGMGLYLMLLLHYLSRINVLLKDISPLVRLLSSLLFWAVPILYYPSENWKSWNLLNPFTIPLDIFRYVTIPNYEAHFAWSGIWMFFLAFGLVFFLARTKLQKIILDHL